jgi:hypothetical protein
MHSALQLWSLAILVLVFILVTLSLLINMRSEGEDPQSQRKRLGSDPQAPRQFDFHSWHCCVSTFITAAMWKCVDKPQSTKASKMEKFAKLEKRKVGLLVSL